MNGADTAWIIVATALVLFMTLPGLALFYGGLVRARNVLSVFMQVYAIACLMSVLWLVAGYSIAFGSGTSGYWGGLDKMFLLGVDADVLSGTLPEVLFFAFQMTFAVITPALIVGAYVERINFSFVLIFSGLWMLLCYAPVVHWIWGGGMMSNGGIFGEVGAKDFAGGIVVHETAGLAALLLAMMLGPRKNRTTPPHNPGYVMIGASMLWVGWFGFNGRWCGDGTDRDTYFCGNRVFDMGVVGKDQIRHGVLGRHRYRYDCRLGIHHTCVRVCWPDRGIGDWRGCRHPMPRGRERGAQHIENRRYTRRLRGTWCGRYVRHTDDSGLWPWRMGCTSWRVDLCGYFYFGRVLHPDQGHANFRATAC